MEEADFYSELFEKGSAQPGRDSVKLTVPDSGVRKRIDFRKGVWVSKTSLEHYLSLKLNFVPSLVATVSSLGELHPFIDVDVSGAVSPDDKRDFAEEFCENLTELFGGEWSYSTRGDPGGIHFHARRIRIQSNQYSEFVQSITDSLTLPSEYKLDVPSNITLPGCGKEANSAYVYKLTSGENEPLPWCTHPDPECALKSFVQKRKNNDDAPCPIAKKMVIFDDKDRVLDILHLEAVNYISDFSPETALLYVALKLPPTNVDLQLYRAAESVLSRLPPFSEEAIRMAVASEYLQNSSQTLTRLNGRNILISPFIKNYAAEMDKNCVLASELFSLQYPMREVNSKTLQIYDVNGWRNESMEFVDILHQYFRVIVNPLTPLKKKHSFVFWYFNKLIETLNQLMIDKLLLITNDGYFVCSGTPRLVRASVLLPSAAIQTLDMSRLELQNVFDRIEATDYIRWFSETLSRVDRVNAGEMSFEELLGENFDEDPGKMLAYFLITFFELNVQTVQQYLNLMFDVCRMGRKKIIMFFTGVSANNGKTTHIKLLNFAFGGFIGTFNVREMSRRNHSTANPDMVVNSKKYMTTCDETGNVPLDTNMLKSFTGDSQVSGRMFFANNQVFTCNSILLLHGNTRPVLEMDAGIQERSYDFKVNTKFKKGKCFRTYVRNRHTDNSTLPVVNFTSKMLQAMGRFYLGFLLLMEKFSVPEMGVSHLGTPEDFFESRLEEDPEGFIMDETMLEAMKIYCFDSTVHHEQFVNLFKMKYYKYFDIGTKMWTNIKLK